MDDSLFVPELLKHVRERENYLVATAKNGVEAPETSVSGKPDLVITDLSMAEIDGIALVAKLKYEFSTRFIPVILLTGDGDHNPEAASSDVGTDEFFMKPIDPNVWGFGATVS